MGKLKFEWTRSKVEKLITLFEKHKILYDKSQADYTDKEKRQQTLDTLLTQFHDDEYDQFLTVETVKLKLRNLRTQYAREFQFVENAKSKGMKTKPRLWCYNKLCFLREHIQKRSGFPLEHDTELGYLVETTTLDQSAECNDPIGKNDDISNFDGDEDSNASEQIDCIGELAEKEEVYNNNVEPKQELYEGVDVENIQSDPDTYNGAYRKRKHIDIEADTETDRVPKIAYTINTRENSLSPISNHLVNVAEVLSYTNDRRYDWLGKQVVFEMSKIQSEEVQEEAAWAIQSILRNHVLKDRSLRKVQK